MTRGLETVRSAVLAEAQRAVATRSWQLDASRLLVLHAAVAALSSAVAVLALGHAPIARGVGVPAVVVAIGCSIIAALVPSGFSRAWTGASLVSACAAAAAHLAGFASEAPGALLADAECALAELAVAALPVGATVLTLRTFAYDRSRALVGSSAAAWTGVLVLDLCCPAEGSAHALLFHLLPAALVVVVATAARARSGSHAHVP